jgi:hypothetical protein
LRDKLKVAKFENVIGAKDMDKVAECWIAPLPDFMISPGDGTQQTIFYDTDSLIILIAAARSKKKKKSSTPKKKRTAPKKR